MSKLNLPLASPFSKENLQYAFDQLARFANKGIGADNITANSLTGAEIDESTLSGIPLSALAAVAWTTYTPTWTLTVGSPVVGNGTLTGHYIQIGKFVQVMIYFAWGSSTTGDPGGATGEWRLSLPITSSGFIAQGAAKLVDSSAGVAYPAMAELFTTTTLRLIYGANPAFIDVVRNNAPFTWATSDTMGLTFSYEAA